MRISNELEASPAIVLSGAKCPVNRVEIDGCDASSPRTSLGGEMLKDGLPLSLPTQGGSGEEDAKVKPLENTKNKSWQKYFIQ